MKLTDEEVKKVYPNSPKPFISLYPKKKKIKKKKRKRGLKRGQWKQVKKNV